MTPTMSLEKDAVMDQKIAEAFNVVFEVPVDQVTDALTPQDVTGWDSLGHVRLVNQLQEQFGLEFEVDEVMRMENVGEIKKILAARAVAA
jgi:acyl carrier protein